MKHSVLRFQCDPGDSSDPEVTVFLQRKVEVDGKEYNIEGMGTPILVKFSELGSLLDLTNASKIIKVSEDRAAKAAAEKAAAEAAAKKVAENPKS